MRFSGDHPATQGRRLAQAVRQMVRDTPAFAAGFGALVGGLAASSLLSQFAEIRAALDVFAPSWTLVAAAEAIGAAVALAKLDNRRLWG